MFYNAVTCLQGDVEYTNRWTCDTCHLNTTVAPAHHNLLTHDVKTEYYLCPGCDYADVIGMRFLAHINRHIFRLQPLGNCWEVDQPPVRRFSTCAFAPTCDFQTNSADKLAKHLTLVHAQRPATLHPERWPLPLSPVCKFPPSLAQIARQHRTTMIGKLYGEATDVIIFCDKIPYGVLAIRSLHGDRLGLACIRRHPGHPCYNASTDRDRDDNELPRSKAELCDVTATPWTVLLTISIDARLQPNATYHLVQTVPRVEQFAIKIIEHRY